MVLCKYSKTLGAGQYLANQCVVMLMHLCLCVLRLQVVSRHNNTSDTVRPMSGENGSIPAVLTDGRDRRANRNMVEAATNQTVMSAWQ